MSITDDDTHAKLAHNLQGKSVAEHHHAFSSRYVVKGRPLFTLITW